MEWVEFLDSLARSRGLKAHLIKTLKVRLDQRNDGESNIKIAAKLNISGADIKKQLGEIYEIFAPSCPDLASSQSRGKLDVLRACLWQQYERHQSQSPEPAIVGTPSNLPLSGVVKFVGRDEALAAVHQKLQAMATVAISSVSGMSGVGKTELALQYAYGKLREAAYPGGICWVNTRAQDVGIGILEFARVQLGLPEPPETLKTVPEQVQWVCRRWQGEPILLVLDDVVDYGAVEPYLQQLDLRFRVLMTTRLKLGTPAQRLELEVLSEAAALELLKSLLDDAERIDTQIGDAQKLCEWLGYLPLALELVGRYLLDDEDISLAEMLELLQQERLAAEALLKAYPEMTASLGVATAFELSWKELNADAKKLSGLLSIFALAPIPWELVEQCLPNWQTRNLAECRDRQLKKRSLLQRVRQERYQLHQLIREFFVVKLETELVVEVADQLRRSFAEVLATVAKTIPQTVTLDVIERVEDALPHLVVASDLTHCVEGVNKIWASTGLVRVAEAQSRWQDAEQWSKKALLLSEQQLGSDHPTTASSLNNLAMLYKSMGRYGEAEPLYARALQISETHLGQDDPATATSLNNLAGLYELMGRYVEADLLYLRSHQILETQLDKDDPRITTSLNNLAELYRITGRYTKAEQFHLEVLQIRETQLGSNHLDTAASLGNLANLYNAMQRYSEAKPLYLRSLQIRETQLGSDHPTTATSLNDLAALYYKIEWHDKAESLFQRALQIRETQLGSDHPDTAQIINNLALLYNSMGRYGEAEPLYKRSLQISEIKLGSEHSITATGLNNLAGLYYAMGRYGEAEPLLSKALAIAEQQLGIAHPTTLQFRQNLADLLRTMSYGTSQRNNPLLWTA